MHMHVKTTYQMQIRTRSEADCSPSRRSSCATSPRSLCSLGAKTIPHGSHRTDQARLAGDVDLRAQAMDVELEVVLRGLGDQAPPGLHQLSARDDRVGAAHEQFEEGKLPPRQGDDLTCPCQLTAHGVQAP